jgi:CubicO group peptidase (beta-lactamase class C family)
MFTDEGESMNVPAHLVAGAAFLTLWGCSGPDPAPPPAPSGVTLEVRRRIDDAVAEGFSGAILVTAGGARVTVEAHGLADPEAGTPNTVQTAFDVGSILKSFTTTAIFRLAQDGALQLDATLADIFPDVPADKAAITLLEVIQHRAGFDEYHDTSGDFEPMTRLEARDRILSQELLFEPGTDAAYSNSGYTLLADVVETVAGEPYVAFVRRTLFEPAGMTSSGFYAESVWQRVDTAIGYGASTFGDNDPATWPYTWALVGNGGLVTTVGDLDRWITALFGGDVVGTDTLEQLEELYFVEGAASIGEELVYAEAGAGDYGLGGVAIFAPESETRVIVGTNAYDDFDIESFAAELALLLLDAN